MKRFGLEIGKNQNLYFVRDRLVSDKSMVKKYHGSYSNLSHAQSKIDRLNATSKPIEKPYIIT